MSMIRDIPKSTRYFWQDSVADQVALLVYDYTSSVVKRTLNPNEILAMALNEIAYSQGEGFFFYLRTRDGRHDDDKVILPESRKPPSPSALYPAIIYMPLVWDEDMRHGFAQESHRGRYLKCSAAINPPAADTPLYGIQHISHLRAMIFDTPIPSLVILSAGDDLFMISTDELKGTVGVWDKYHKAKGPDPEQRLNSPSSLWKAETQGGAPEKQEDAADGSVANQQDATPTKQQLITARQRDKRHAKQLALVAKQQAVRRFKVDSLVALYDIILQRCAPFQLQSGFTAVEMLTNIIPRPISPEAGIPLGTEEGGGLVTASALPPSRRGKTMKRKARDIDVDDTASAAVEHRAEE